MSKRENEAAAASAKAAKADADGSDFATHAVAADRDAWRKERVKLLQAEKEWTRAKDELARQRRALPWLKVDDAAAYAFVEASTDADARRTLSLRELFGDKHDQLIVYHFMFDPDNDIGCSSCSFIADHFDGMLPHLGRKAAFVAVAKARPEQIARMVDAKQWKFPFFSSHSSTFNADFGVTFDNGRDVDFVNYNYNEKAKSYKMREYPGCSVFARRGDDVFHTYSTYGRGLDILIGAYNYIDLLPRGRAEKSPMDWLKHKERYDVPAGAKAASHLPPGSSGTLTAYLVTDNGTAAMAWYKKVFGARVLECYEDKPGRVAHAELALGDDGARVSLADESKEWGTRSAKTIGDTPVGLQLYVRDVDATFALAVKEGAKAERELKTQFYGDRSGSVVDPFGFRWTLSQHVEDVSHDEIMARMAKMGGGGGGGSDGGDGGGGDGGASATTAAAAVAE